LHNKHLGKKSLEYILLVTWLHCIALATDLFSHLTNRFSSCRINDVLTWQPGFILRTRSRNTWQSCS